ncbi:MAG TPA: SMC-Scp complex subunit ScpB [Candidatus Angelobacter sp.]|nr:SMC-Scp complex subunit ScpB [Candidatus Angelobacter sp.]
MSIIKTKLEALIYAAEEPIGIDHMAALLKEDLLALKTLPAHQPSENGTGPEENATPEHAGEQQAADQHAVNQELEQAQQEAQGTQETEARKQETAPTEKQPTEQQPSHKGAAPDQGPAGKRAAEKAEKLELRTLLTPILEELIAEYDKPERGIEVRQVAGGYRMSTKPEHHDVVRAFAKSLKPPIKLSLQALETLAVIAYKQPVTVPEISEIRGADSGGVIGTLLERKLITTSGRKAVVGRPMLYKTTKDFLMRFGLKDLGELPSIEEFEKIAAGQGQAELFDARDVSIADATGVPDTGEENAEDTAAQETTQNTSEDTAEDTEETATQRTQEEQSSHPSEAQMDSLAEASEPEANQPLETPVVLDASEHTSEPSHASESQHSGDSYIADSPTVDSPEADSTIADSTPADSQFAAPETVKPQAAEPQTVEAQSVDSHPLAVAEEEVHHAHHVEPTAVEESHATEDTTVAAAASKASEGPVG